MKVMLNGKETDVSEGATVATLLSERDINVETVVVEYNRDILPSDQFAATVLKDGDQLEILQFVGGG